MQKMHSSLSPLRLARLWWLCCLWCMVQGMTALPSDFYASSSQLAQGKWVRLKVYNSGLYQLTPSDLQAWGFDDPSRVLVYGYGGAMLPERFAVPYTDDLTQVPVLREGGRLVFYAQGPLSWSFNTSTRRFEQNQHPYSTYGCYFLTQRTDVAPLALQPQPVRSTQGIPISTYDAYTLHEKELSAFTRMGRNLYGEDFRFKQVQSFPFDLSGIVGADATLEINFVARTKTTTLNVGTRLNAISLGRPTSGITEIKVISGANDSYQRGTLANPLYRVATFKDGVNSIAVECTGGTPATANLDFIRINYQRQLVYPGGIFGFRAIYAQTQSVSYRLRGANAATRVWDITSPALPSTVATTLIAGVPCFTPERIGMNEYIAFDPTMELPTPEYNGVVSNQNLHAMEAPDMVILSPPAFVSQAERLARLHRDKDNLSVLVLTPEPIYNEFSSGTPDATAIRRLMRMWYDRRPSGAELGVRYLLLFGDATHDNRLISQEWQRAKYPFLPVFESYESLDEPKSFASDDYYGLLDETSGAILHNDLVRVGVGRFSIRTLSQAKTAVDKVEAYMTNAQLGVWKNDLLFLADNGNSNIHMNQIEKLVTDTLERKYPEFINRKIYLDAFPYVNTATGGRFPDANKRFSDILQEGALLVNYAGHGSTSAWAAEKLLDMNMINNMYIKRLPLFITATCDFTRFDDLETSAGESLFLHPSGGAIALFSTSRIVYASENEAINNAFMSTLFERDLDGRHYRFGDVLRMSKNHPRMKGQFNKLNFLLLGDPALRLRYPDYKMRITKINNQEVTQSPVMLNALSRVEICGEVLTPSGEKATNFNGYLFPRLYDAMERVKTLANNSPEFSDVFNYQTRDRLLFTGKEAVVNGEFKIEVLMPKEISYSEQTGLLNLYAYDIHGNEAHHSYSNITIGGSADVEEDATPPTIHAIYLNTTSFKEGDTVNETPMFVADVEDDLGINISGIGVGHNITLTIDHSQYKQYILNRYFEPEIGKPGKGRVSFMLPELSQGTHTFTFKVWDLQGNSTERTQSFEVEKGLSPSILSLYTDVNPARTSTRFYLQHSLPNQIVTVNISVYSLSGTLLWSYQERGMSDLYTTFPIEWDLTTTGGARLPAGVYLYRAYISTNEVFDATQSKKLIILAQ